MMSFEVCLIWSKTHDVDLHKINEDRLVTLGSVCMKIPICAAAILRHCCSKSVENLDVRKNTAHVK
jgi:hypothetical protein